MNVLSLLSYLCVPLLIPLFIPFFVVPFSSYSYMFRYVHFSLLSSLFTFKSESLSSLPQLVVPIYFLPVLILSFWKTVFMKFLSHFPSKAFLEKSPNTRRIFQLSGRFRNYLLDSLASQDKNFTTTRKYEAK